MTSGLSETMLWRDGYERKHEHDWVRFFYKNGKFDNKPGTSFLYNNANSYILGCLIEKKIWTKFKRIFKISFIRAYWNT